MDPNAARQDFERWRADLPTDPYAADEPLRALVAAGVTPDRAEAIARRAREFGRAVVETVGPAAQRYEHRLHLPELQRWDGLGHRVERIEFDPSYHEAGTAIWVSGVVADSGTPGRAFEQAVLLALLSLEGEAGHACPATCTIGLARALRRKAAPEVRDRFLPPLLDPSYATAQRASQFLTEAQGGSDVGANAAVAEPNADGTYTITGEKWFCSVADADQFLATARVAGGADGTRGLGCFVMPRHLDGRPNGFTIRRLKEKLGTRGMASGEIDLDRAIAWPIGPVEEGFRTAVGVVLNTSRWQTAVGSVGIMRRAYLEASAYARHRRAFGRAIGGFPAVRTTLAGMKVAWLANLHLVMALTALEDRIDDGTASETDVLQHRFLVNATKYAASVAATPVARDAIEVLGGNGTIEEFSVLPRLYRDAMVYESWEGTHNVLVAQVLADLRRLPILDAIDAYLDERLPTAAPAAERLVLAAKDLRPDVERAMADPGYGAGHFRSLLDRWLAVLQGALLLDGGADPAVAAWATSRLDGGYRPERDDAFGERVDAILAGDAG